MLLSKKINFKCASSFFLELASISLPVKIIEIPQGRIAQNCDIKNINTNHTSNKQVERNEGQNVFPNFFHFHWIGILTVQTCAQLLDREVPRYCAFSFSQFPNFPITRSNWSLRSLNKYTFDLIDINIYQ